MGATPSQRVDRESLPPEAAARLERVETVATVLDDSIPVPGTRFRIGIDPVAGVLPIGGDLVTGVLSLYIVAEAAALGVRRWALLRMLANVAVDVTGGSVPVLGTVFDASWKANRRNVRLLRRELERETSATR